MSIISKETWDKFTQEEKDKIKEEFKIRENLVTNGTFSETQLIAKGMIDSYQNLFPKEALHFQPLTYEDVARELLGDKRVYWAYEGEIFNQIYIKNGGGFNDPTLCTSQKQAEKLLAINKLLNVAKYLNKDWKPDWSKGDKFYLFYQYPNECVQIESTIVNNFALVYFKSFELAEQAIEILGEDTVRLALSSDY